MEPLIDTAEDADGFDIDEELIEPDTEIQPIPAPADVATAGGERLEQRRFTGGDTLDEPVLTTLMRDVRGFGRLLLQIAGWKPPQEAGAEWDLWGPLIFCLAMSLALSGSAPANQRSYTFSTVFTIIWCGQGLITLNIKLLGGSISYLQALCVTGYSLFPLVLSSVLTLLVSVRLVRTLFTLVMTAWAVWSAARGLGRAGVLPSRVFLATYPVGLFYVYVGWLCVVS